MAIREAAQADWYGDRAIGGRLARPACQPIPRRSRARTGTLTLPEKLIAARATVLSIVVMLGVSLGVFIVNVASRAAGLDDAASVATELREHGYLVSAVEQLEGGTFLGNDGERLIVPEGARVYRVSFQSSGEGIKAAYRVQGKLWEEQWTFPQGR